MYSTFVVGIRMHNPSYTVHLLATMDRCTCVLFSGLNFKRCRYKISYVALQGMHALGCHIAAFMQHALFTPEDRVKCG